MRSVSSGCWTNEMQPNRFGRRTYYRVRKGERPLSPDEQKSMLNILKQCGINDPGKFDAYFEAYDW